MTLKMTWNQKEIRYYLKKSVGNTTEMYTIWSLSGDNSPILTDQGGDSPNLKEHSDGDTDQGGQWDIYENSMNSFSKLPCSPLPGQQCLSTEKPLSLFSDMFSQALFPPYYPTPVPPISPTTFYVSQIFDHLSFHWVGTKRYKVKHMQGIMLQMCDGPRKVWELRNDLWNEE